MGSFDSFACRFAGFAAVSLAWIAVAVGDDRAGEDWWSLQPLTRPPLPEVSDGTWVKNPIDRFILAKLEAKQLSPSAPADARTLARRLYVDLIGLPPEADELKRAMADVPGAIDALLDSAHYGERWARHWLDVARFG